MTRPKPEWWVRAKALHNDGMTYKEIGINIGKSFYSVRYALCESERQAHKAYHQRVSGSRWQRKPKRIASAEQLIRWNLREKARHLAKDTGRSVEQCYKELGCQ